MAALAQDGSGREGVAWQHWHWFRMGVEGGTAVKMQWHMYKTKRHTTMGHV